MEILTTTYKILNLIFEFYVKGGLTPVLVIALILVAMYALYKEMCFQCIVKTKILFIKLNFFKRKKSNKPSEKIVIDDLMDE